MADVIDFPPDGDDGHLVDPPIIDLLYHEPEERAYVVTFVPEDVVSKERTESVHIPDRSEDGKRIRLWLERLGQLLGLPGPVQKLFHRGGGDFGFYGGGESQAALSEARFSNAVSQHAYIALQDMASTAQIAFLSAHPSGRKSGPGSRLP